MLSYHAIRFITPQFLRTLVESLNYGVDMSNVDWEAVSASLAQQWNARKAPKSTHKELYEVDIAQSWHIARWLRLHGQVRMRVVML